MGEARKTLKVACGSFSCTLHGFDDPVAVLRSVMAHLQSLSALGLIPGPKVRAEPEAQPDAAPPGGSDDPESSPTPVPGAPPPEGAPDETARLRPRDTPDPDSDVGRLLRRTIGQMEGPALRQRRETIGHLKAAVAATAADPGALADGSAERQGRYRADLARAIGPDMTIAGPPPQRPRPGPLVLDPAQRVKPGTAHGTAD